ncbi:barstar family protein [Kitasatospora cineracea]
MPTRRHRPPARGTPPLAPRLRRAGGRPGRLSRPPRAPRPAKRFAPAGARAARWARTKEDGRAAGGPSRVGAAVPGAVPDRRRGRGRRGTATGPVRRRRGPVHRPGPATARGPGPARLRAGGGGRVARAGGDRRPDGERFRRLVDAGGRRGPVGRAGRRRPRAGGRRDRRGRAPRRLAPQRRRPVRPLRTGHPPGRSVGDGPGRRRAGRRPPGGRPAAAAAGRLRTGRTDAGGTAQAARPAPRVHRAVVAGRHRAGDGPAGDRVRRGVDQAVGARWGPGRRAADGRGRRSARFGGPRGLAAVAGRAAAAGGQLARVRRGGEACLADAGPAQRASPRAGPLRRRVPPAGADLRNASGLHCAIGEALLGPGSYYGWGLDALSDSLCGGFGLVPPFTLVWHDFAATEEELAADRDPATGLGYPEELARELERDGVTVVRA